MSAFTVTICMSTACLELLIIVDITKMMYCGSRTRAEGHTLRYVHTLVFGPTQHSPAGYSFPYPESRFGIELAAILLFLIIEPIRVSLVSRDTKHIFIHSRSATTFVFTSFILFSFQRTFFILLHISLFSFCRPFGEISRRMRGV